MFVLPRVLAVEDGEEIRANIGRFGPYVQRGKLFVSIPKELDVFTVSLEQAMELIEAKAEARKKQVIQRFEPSGIEIRTGRFGHYVTDGKLNAKLGKLDPKKVTEAEASSLLEAKRTGK
jgi:DNA topoisomerase-1